MASDTVPEFYKISMGISNSYTDKHMGAATKSSHLGVFLALLNNQTTLGFAALVIMQPCYHDPSTKIDAPAESVIHQCY